MRKKSTVFVRPIKCSNGIARDHKADSKGRVSYSISDRRRPYLSDKKNTGQTARRCPARHSGFVNKCVHRSMEIRGLPSSSPCPHHARTIFFAITTGSNIPVVSFIIVGPVVFDSLLVERMARRLQARQVRSTRIYSLRKS